MKFNDDKFFDGYREQFGPLSQQQVNGLSELLICIEDDQALTDVRWIAYMLATTYHETAHTFHPIAEYGKGRGRSYGTPDPVTGQTYYGRGYVQLTWKRNYKLFADELGIDLVHQPDLAMEPETAYKIMSQGMRGGMFTGKSLGHYISENGCDFVNARKIINGLDKATTIASYADRFVKILEASAE